MKTKKPLKELVKDKGISQRWIADHFGVHESLVSLAVKHENFPPKLRKFLEGR